MFTETRLEQETQKREYFRVDDVIGVYIKPLYGDPDSIYQQYVESHVGGYNRYNLPQPFWTNRLVRPQSTAVMELAKTVLAMELKVEMLFRKAYFNDTSLASIYLPRAVNLSLSGIRFQIDRNSLCFWEHTSTVDLWLLLPGMSFPIQMLCKIVRIEEGENPDFGPAVAFRFAYLQEADRNLLQRYISWRQNSSGLPIVQT